MLRCPECKEVESFTKTAIADVTIEIVDYADGQGTESVEMEDIIKVETVRCNSCKYEGPEAAFYTPAPEEKMKVTAKRLTELAVALRDIEVLNGCVPEEVEIDCMSIEVILSDNPLVPQLVFEVTRLIALAHPKDVKMKISSVGDYADITAQF